MFVDLMEQSSLIIQAGQMMIEKSLQDLHNNQKSFDPDFFVSINISGRQFADPEFLSHLEGTRSRLGLSGFG